MAEVEIVGAESMLPSGEHVDVFLTELIWDGNVDLFGNLRDNRLLFRLGVLANRALLDISLLDGGSGGRRLLGVVNRLPIREGKNFPTICPLGKSVL